MQRERLTLLYTLLLLLFFHPMVFAQGDASCRIEITKLVNSNDSLYDQIVSQGNDTTGIGLMISQLDEYLTLLKSPDTRSLVEDNSNVEIMLARLALFYQVTRSYNFDDFHSFFEDYYKESDADDYMYYCNVNEQYYMYLLNQRRFFAASEVAIAMNNEAEAASDSTLVSSITKFYVANAFAMQNNVSKTEQWLNDSYVASKGKAESCENEFLIQRYGDMLVTRARLLSMKSRYNEAEDTLDEMINFAKKHYGEQSLEYANCLLTKADFLVLQLRMSDLQKICDEAETIITALTEIEPTIKQNMQAALENFKQKLGNNTSAITETPLPLIPEANKHLISLWNQVSQANLTFDWHKVLEAGREWLDLVEQFEQINFKEYDVMIQHVTQSFINLGLYPEASQFLDHAQSFVIKQNAYDPYADRYILLQKGRLYAALGNKNLAATYYNKSKAMYEKLEDHSIFYVQCLAMMTEFFFLNNDWAYAKLFIDELSGIIADYTQGLKDENLSSVMPYKNSLASYLLMMGYKAQAIEDLKESLLYYEEIHDDYNWYATFIRLMSGYIQSQDFDAVAELLNQIDKHNIPLREKRHLKMAYGMIMRDVGAVDDLEQYNNDMKNEIEAVHRSFDPTEQETFWEGHVKWLNWYNNLLAIRMPDNPRVMQQTYNNSLYVRRSNLEKPIYKWDEIKELLDENEVAIEMISSSDFTNNGEEKYLYAALVLRKGYDAPKLVTLCETESLGRIWQNVIHTDTALINKLYSMDNSILYELVWEPLAPLLRNGDKVYFVPTGYLNRINFSALAADGVRLSEQYQLNQLSSTAELFRIKAFKKELYQDAAIYGGISYNESNEDMLSAASTYSIKESDKGSTRSASRGAVVERLISLPGTGEEAVLIRKILNDVRINAEIYDGTKANEESIKAFSGHSPDIIHVGTHGFLLNTTSDIMEHQSFLERMTYNQQQVSVLNYSGLMFAGAEKAWNGEDIPGGVEDGVLTSLELSQLDLSRTQLMVLSACETALGHTDESLGDFGLKRALKQAGVGTIIVSLWEVPDDSTKLLMSSFYKLLAEGKDCHEALEKAQMEVQRTYPQPYYWASFVIID